jgi:serine/threonine protein phosphatase PrpC
MAKSIINSIMTDVDQQIGSTDKDATIEDQFAKGVSIGGLFVSIVADGGGKNAPTDAAKLTIDTILAECGRRKGHAPLDILRYSLHAANKAVYELSHGDDYVGVTITAIKDDRLYIGQAGNITRAYLVGNNSKPTPILSQSDSQSETCLGDRPDQTDINVEQFKDTLKQGERIIVCSDGLFDPPDDPKNPKIKTEIIEKLIKEMPFIGHYNDIRGSAKHLSSIAKGMDVTDDITVLVIGFGRKPREISKPMLFTIFGIAALTVITLAVILLTPKASIPPTDLGVAYLVTGNANLIDAQNNVTTQSGQIVAAGATIQVSPNGPVNVALETRSDAQVADLTFIPGVSLYLAQTTVANFTMINLASYTIENKPTDPNLLNQTQIALLEGQLLIVSNGNRNYVILISNQNGKAEIRIQLNAGGKGILGVKRTNTSLEVYCLQGICQLLLADNQSQLLSAPGKSIIDLGIANIATKDQPIMESDMNNWISICQNAQLPNVTQSENCNLSK